MRAEVFSFNGPMLVIILGVLWGGDVIAGEVDRGTIDILLANPISRRPVVLEELAALLVGVALAVLGLGVGLAIAVPSVGLKVGWTPLAAAVVATALLGALYAAVALAPGQQPGGEGSLGDSPPCWRSPHTCRAPCPISSGGSVRSAHSRLGTTRSAWTPDVWLSPGASGGAGGNGHDRSGGCDHDLRQA